MNAVKSAGLWGPVAFYTGWIFWLSSGYRPVPGMRFFAQMDKLWHLAEYAPYGLLWIRAIRGTFRKFSWRQAWAAAFLAAAAVAALDEHFQSFIPIKFASPWDWMADAAGAAAGLWFYRACFPDEPAGT